MTNLEKQIEGILNRHAEYYIEQTVKFFQNTGESPAISKNNKGDIEAKAALKQMIIDARIDEWKRSREVWSGNDDFKFADKMNKRIGQLFKYLEEK